MPRLEIPKKCLGSGWGSTHREVPLRAEDLILVIATPSPFGELVLLAQLTKKSWLFQLLRGSSEFLFELFNHQR